MKQRKSDSDENKGDGKITIERLLSFKANRENRSTR